MKFLKEGIRMSKSEEQLYYACMNFCESFFHLLCEKEKVRHSFYDDYTKREIMEFEEKRIDSDYNILFQAVEDYENDMKGVVGANQYRLELKKVR